MGIFNVKYTRSTNNYLKLNNNDFTIDHKIIRYVNDEKINFPRFILYENNKLIWSVHKYGIESYNLNTFNKSIIKREVLDKEKLSYVNTIIIKKCKIFFYKTTTVIFNPKNGTYMRLQRDYMTSGNVSFQYLMSLRGMLNSNYNHIVLK